MYTFLLFFTGIFFYVSLYMRTKDKLYPSAVLLFIWYLSASISSIPSFYVPGLQNEWGSTMMLVVYCSGLAFYIPSFLLANKSVKITTSSIYFTSFYKIIFNFFLFLSVLAFILHFSQNGFNITILSSANDLKSTIPPALHGIHYFEILIPYLALASFFELQTSANISKKRKYILYLYIFFAIVIYSFLFAVSKGTILIFLLGIMYYYNRRYYITWKKIFILVPTLFIIIGLFSLLRMNSDSMVLTHFGTSVWSKMFSSFYTYIAYNFENLNKLVISDVSETGVWYSLKVFLYPVFFDEYHTNSMNLIKFDTLFFNARTYLYPFYHDLHFIGVLIYPFILGVLISFISYLSRKNLMYILLIMSIQKAIYFTFFGNYFFGEFIIFFPYLFILLLIFSNKITIQKKKNDHESRKEYANTY